jgi:hypothetical protein
MLTWSARKQARLVAQAEACGHAALREGLMAASLDVTAWRCLRSAKPDYVTLGGSMQGSTTYMPPR